MSVALLIFCLTVVAYAIAGSSYTQQFFTRSNKLASLAQVSLMLGLSGHLLLLILETHNYDGKQLSLSFVATLLAWLVTLTIMISHRFIKNLLFLPVVCFVSILFITLNMFTPFTSGINVQMSVSMILHILLSLMAYGMLSISMLYACQLAYIKYQLKHKKRILLTGSLPPLMSVESILYKLMTLGAGVLVIALLTGFLFVPNMMAEGYAHKTILSSISLVCYVACIVLHNTIGLKARVTIVLNLLGLTLLTLGYFGSRLVKEFLLN